MKDGAETVVIDWREKTKAKADARNTEKVTEEANWAVFDSSVPPGVTDRPPIAFRVALNAPSQILVVPPCTKRQRKSLMYCQLQIRK